MNAAGEVCIDASLAIKLVIAEPDSDKADALFAHFADQGARLIAPVFFSLETDSVLRQKVLVRKELTSEQAEASFAKLVALLDRSMSSFPPRLRDVAMPISFLQ